VGKAWSMPQIEAPKRCLIREGFGFYSLAKFFRPSRLQKWGCLTSKSDISETKFVAKAVVILVTLKSAAKL